MELSKQERYTALKNINNTKKLPGFENGGTFADSYGEPLPGLGDYSKSTGGLQSASTHNAMSLTPQNGGPVLKDNGGGKSDSAAAGIGPWFALGAWLGGGVLEGLNSVTKRNQLVANAGTSQGNIGGISYQQQNLVDPGSVMNEYNKGAAKDWLTNPGRAITKLFTKNKQREEAYQARQMGIRNNDFMRSVALSSAIGQNAALRVGNTQSQVLAADGLTPNARVSNGETIINPDGSTFRVGRGKDNKDSIPVHLSDGQGVITNKYGLSDLAQINPGLALNMQTTLKQQGKLSGYKNGKLPRFENGWGNITSGILGGLASIQQYLDAARQDIKVPDIYAVNPYEQAALNSMANTYINPIPAANKIWDAYRYANWSVDRSGGLSGGQRNRTKAANLATTQRSLADAYIAGQAQNNQYKQSFDQARLNAGQATRAAQMDANKFKEQYTAAAHNARQQGMQMGIYNFINQLQSYYANEFKRRQFNDTMDLYKQQQQLDRERLEWELGKNKPAENFYFNPYKQVYVPKGAVMFPNPINNNWRDVRLNLK